MSSVEKHQYKKLQKNPSSSSASAAPIPSSETAAAGPTTSSKTRDESTSTTISERHRLAERRSSQNQANKLELELERLSAIENLTVDSMDSDQMKLFQEPGGTNSSGIIKQTQSYTNAIHNLLNNSNVRVKIADLGNACYDVR